MLAKRERERKKINMAKINKQVGKGRKRHPKINASRVHLTEKVESRFARQITAHAYKKIADLIIAIRWAARRTGAGAGRINWQRSLAAKYKFDDRLIYC